MGIADKLVLLLLLRTAAAVYPHESMQSQHTTAKQPLRPTKPADPAQGSRPKKPSQTHITQPKGGPDLSAWAAAKPADVANNAAMIVRPLDDSVQAQDEVSLAAKVDNGNDLSVAASDDAYPSDNVDAAEMGSNVRLEAAGPQGQPRMDESKWDVEKGVVSIQAAEEDTQEDEADHGQESGAREPCEPGGPACVHNLNTTILRGKEEHNDFGLLGSKNSPVTIIMVLAVSAGCTGCGLMSIILTGVYTLARAINKYLWREPSAAEARGHEIPLEEMRDLAPDPPKPVVIIAPDNGVVVGFEVIKAVPIKIQKQHSTCSSLEEIRIDVDAGAFSQMGAQGLPSPPQSLPPRSILLSPLGPRNLRHDRREAAQGLQSPPVSNPAQPRQDMVRNPSSPPLLPPQSPE